VFGQTYATKQKQEAQLSPRDRPSAAYNVEGK